LSTINEEKFKDTLKALVQDEPEKLAFFDGLEQPTAVPPFIPTGKNERIQTDPSIKTRRRHYTYGMAAAAACFIVFISITVAGLSSSMNMKTMSVSYDAMEAVAGGGMDTGIMAEAPMAPDEAPVAQTEAQADAPATSAVEPATAPTLPQLNEDEVLPAADATEGYEAEISEAPAPAPVCDLGTGMENEAAEGSADDDTVTMDRGDDEPASVPASAKTVFIITLIYAIISAALFVTFLIKRRKLR